MITEKPEKTNIRAEKLRELLKERGIETRVIKTEALVGGGAMPDEKIRSYGIAFKNDIHSLEEKMWNSYNWKNKREYVYSRSKNY